MFFLSFLLKLRIRVCTCVCLCIYVYMNICMYICVYVYLCVFLCLCVCMYICISVWMSMCISVCVSVSVCGCIFVCASVCMCGVFKCMYIFGCVYLCVYVYIYFVCIYVCICAYICGCVCLGNLFARTPPVCFFEMSLSTLQSLSSFLSSPSLLLPLFLQFSLLETELRASQMLGKSFTCDPTPGTSFSSVLKPLWRGITCFLYICLIALLG